jgi:hypothetical protein
MKVLGETTPTVVHPGGTFRTQLTTTTRGFAQPVPLTEKNNRQTETIPSADYRQTETVPGEDYCQTISAPDKRMTKTAPQTDIRLTETAPGAQGIPLEACPPFDAAKYVLGKLCPQRHEWGSTGQTRLSLHSRNCPECRNIYKREKRAAQRQQP